MDLSYNPRKTVSLLDFHENRCYLPTFSGGRRGIHMKFNKLRSSLVITALLLVGTCGPAYCATASFVKFDTATRGAWVGVYGVDGYDLAADSNVRIPPYVALSPAGSSYVWAKPSTDPRALQEPENPTVSFAATWFSGSTFTIGANITDTGTHQVALYLVDWDTTTRAESITVKDAVSGTPLTSAIAVTNFHGGEYAVFDVSGDVDFVITLTGGANAVVSAVFFDPVPSAGTLAVPVNSFVNSLGVNTKISSGSTAPYASMFQYLGIHNARDGGLNYLSQDIALHNTAGVMFEYVCEPLSSSALNDCISDSQQLAAAGAYLFVEGPNEENNFPFNYGTGPIGPDPNGYTGTTCGYGGDWGPCAQWQAAFYSAFKSALPNYPVAQASEQGSEWTDVGMQCLSTNAQGAVDGAAPVTCGNAAKLAAWFPQSQVSAGIPYADLENGHPYVAAGVDNGPWFMMAPGSVPCQMAGDCAYADYVVTWEKGFKGYSTMSVLTVPKVVTETGYVVGDDSRCSQDQQGKGTLEIFLDYFKQNALPSFEPYVSIFEMVDGEGGCCGTYGLYTSAYQPKLAATYLHNMTTILADAGGMFTPGSAQVSVTAEPATVHDMLMEKSTSLFEWAIWDERFATATTDTVTANLGKSYTTVNVYDPTIGTAPIQTYTNVSSVQLGLVDHPVIVEFH
jgi:hypothetical protein